LGKEKDSNKTTDKNLENTYQRVASRGDVIGYKLNLGDQNNQQQSSSSSLPPSSEPPKDKTKNQGK
jgi:hypothetical protein